MKLGLKAVVSCALCACVASCGSDDGEKTPCEADNYVSACNSDLTHVYVCEGGVVAAKKCSHSCDAATGTCANPDGSVTICTNASYPAACKEGETAVRTYCKNGLKAEETCKTGETCIGGSCVEFCTEADYPTSCKDSSTLTYCSGGQKYDRKCPGKCENGDCVAIEAECTEADYPSACLNSAIRAYCKEGKKAQETCGAGCENGQCKSSADSCGSDYADSCETPIVRKYCKDGVIAREVCKGGKVCNGSLKNKTCKTPSVGEACTPNTFPERCTGNASALMCDDETGKVVRVDCSDYGDGYKCDIAENFYGVNVDAAICYAQTDNCDDEPEGNETFEYCYEDDDTGYRWFYRNTYVCHAFNTGKHRYLAETEPCPDKGKCGQSDIRHACY